jgi:hypothetical protein
MTREKGTASFSANFEAQKAAPIDARMLVGQLSDLTNPTVWQANDGGTYVYPGMIVSVFDDSDFNNGLYFLKELPFTDIDNWKKLGEGLEEIAGDPIQVIYAQEDDVLIFDGTAWINVPKQTLTDGGTF